MGNLKDHPHHLPQNSDLRTLVFWLWLRWSVPEPVEFWLFRGITNEITAPRRGLVLSSLSTILNHKILLAAWHRAGVLICCSPSFHIWKLFSWDYTGFLTEKTTENTQSGTNVTLLSEIAELLCAYLPSLTMALQAFKDDCGAGRDWAVPASRLNFHLGSWHPRMQCKFWSWWSSWELRWLAGLRNWGPGLSKTAFTLTCVSMDVWYPQEKHKVRTEHSNPVICKGKGKLSLDASRSLARVWLPTSSSSASWKCFHCSVMSTSNNLSTVVSLQWILNSLYPRQWVPI